MYRKLIYALFFHVKEQRMKKADTTKRAQEKRRGFTKKIGNTTYDVSFHYSGQSRESMNEPPYAERHVLVVWEGEKISP